MRAYIVWNRRSDLYEVYSLKPQWNQESAYWSGVGFIDMVTGDELPVSVANEAKRSESAIPCHVVIKVEYAYVNQVKNKEGE